LSKKRQREGEPEKEANSILHMSKDKMRSER
jgi:hypothetical protein